MFYQTIPNDLQTWMSTLSNSGAWVLLATGIFAIIIVFSEGYRQGGFFHKKYDSSFDADLSRLLIIFIIFALVMGIIALISGILTIWLDQPPSDTYAQNVGDHWDPFTSVLLVVMGIVLLFQPLKNVPILSLIGFFVGIAAGIIIILIIPSSWLDYLHLQTNLSLQWLYIVIFVIGAAFIGLSLKFWFSGLEMISKILSWPPIAFILGIVCLIQALVLLIFGHSLWIF